MELTKILGLRSLVNCLYGTYENLRLKIFSELEGNNNNKIVGVHINRCRRPNQNFGLPTLEINFLLQIKIYF